MKRAFGMGMMVAALAAGALVQAQSPRSAEVQMKAAQQKAEVEGDLKGAIEEYKKVVAAAGSNRALAAQALVRMADCYQKLGDVEAGKIYERLLRDFGDQKDAIAEARSRLAVSRLAAPAKNEAREVWTGAGNGMRGATPSADGRYLSFTDIESGNVAVRDVVAGTDRRLTTTADWSSEYADASAVSPDSRHVAYTWYIHKENKVELRVVPIAGAEAVRPRTVLRTELSDGGPYKIVWMPDGDQLLVIRSLGDRTSQISKVAVQDGSFRTIKSLEWRRPNLLSLSPDGRYVAYDVPAGEAGSPLDILVLATDGSRETVAVKNPANDAFPVWSPDGAHLVFLSDRTGSNALWTVPIQDGRATGAARLIKADVGPINLLGMTKPGTLYYFELTTVPANLYIADLATMHAAKAPEPATERVISNNFGPTWSRDGEWLAYYSFRDTSAGAPSAVLVIRTVKTGDERTVTLPSRVTWRFGNGPKWFADNRSVLVQSGDAEGPGFGFYRVALDTANTELLTRVPRLANAYDLSPDGRTIFYEVIASDEHRLMRFDIDSGRETELAKKPVTESDAEAVALSVSPDGRELATTVIGGAVQVRPTTGGAARDVFRPAVRELGTGATRLALTWTPDQRFLLFVRGSDRLLWKVPALGGDAQKTGLSMLGIKSPSVHPDGRRLVFSAWPAPNTSKVWALENVLPAGASNAKR